jgi:HopA1 effector protein family
MLNILTEIVSKIEIRQDFTICHSDYPPYELQPNIAATLSLTSLQLQQKYLIAQVQKYLYRIYFSHSLMSLKESAERSQSQLKVKNNIVNGADIEFCQQLHQNNASNGYIDSDWQVIGKTNDAELIVVKAGLHLHINPQQHLSKDLRQPANGDVVPIYLPKNIVGPDTYIAIGNLGVSDPAQSVQLFFNFTPSAAIEIMHELTQALNELSIPFQFAILHNPALFYRYDTGSLWLSKPCYLATQTLLQRIYKARLASFYPNIPLFSKQLAPGLGIAETLTISDTFGEQRCQLLAMSLVASMDQDRQLHTSKLNIIHQTFAAAGINWLQPHLNPYASDIYSVIE